MALAWCYRGVSHVLRAAGGRLSSTAAAAGKRANGLDLLYQEIKFSGPITVSDYMKQCLLNPFFGYYMQGDVFGARGDFITSPEISQVFGELLAVWVLADWKSHGETTPIQLVELGPGRGTLLKDMLRVFSHNKLRSFLDGLSIHLVEASPPLSDIQHETILATPSHTPQPLAKPTRDPLPYKTSQVDNVEVYWYQQLKDVPHGRAYYIAHEFFDALPVHQFQMTSSGWREVLVDIDPTQSSHRALRFVLSPSATPASSLYTAGCVGQEGAWLEVCPQGLVHAQEIGDRVARNGGAALIADYGGTGASKNTLRAFSKHQQCPVLATPGLADLTADVDFQALGNAARAKGAGTVGPISQNEFLHKLGIRQRMEGLMGGASPSQAEDLVSSYQMLTSPEQMGERFKFFTITSSPEHIPVPFFSDVRIAE